jgi:hypothetical protein
MAGAQGALDCVEAEMAEAWRLLLREVRTGFVRGLVAIDLTALLVDELLAATERHEAGEATALELNRVPTVAARAG